jgi:hypothetical protein
MYAEPSGASLAAELASGLALMETDRLSYDRVFGLMGRQAGDDSGSMRGLGCGHAKRAVRQYTIREQLEEFLVGLA